MNVYNINWDVIINSFLLRPLNKPLVRAMLKAPLQPFVLMHIDLLNFRERCLYRIRHNSQICYMEAVLNDLFDNSLRRIRIVNVTFREPIYFYEPEENREVYFYEVEPVYFREQEDFAGEGVDFLVCVPPDLQPANEEVIAAFITRMSAQVEFYKLYSKNFKIIWEQVND